MKFMNAGATGKKGTELEAKIFRTKKVTCLSTFTRDVDVAGDRRGRSHLDDLAEEHRRPPYAMQF